MVHNLKISFDSNSSTYFHSQLYRFSKAIKASVDFVSIISEFNDFDVLLRISDYLGESLALRGKIFSEALSVRGNWFFLD